MSEKDVIQSIFEICEKHSTVGIDSSKNEYEKIILLQNVLMSIMAIRTGAKLQKK